MPFPIERPRRMRGNEKLRSFIRETRLDASKLVYPLFACPGTKVKQEISSTFGADYNFSQGEAHQTIGQITYNFGCFGVDLEYRRFALGPLRRENQIRFSLSLSNIGSFGNIGAHQGLY